MNDLWPHQKRAFEFAVDRTASMFVMKMGTGKTLVTIRLLQHWNCRHVLVLCPQTVIGVWGGELEKWWPKFNNVCLCKKNQSIPKRLKSAQAAIAKRQAIVVANYEMLSSGRFFDWCNTRSWDAIILDESHRAKGPQSKVSKRTATLRWKAARRLCLTGTPMPNNQLDVFGQYRFLDPAVFGGARARDWWSFRATYAVLKTIPGVSAQVVVGERNKKMLQRKMAELCFYVGSEVLNLPEATDTLVDVQFSAEGLAAYREMEREFITWIDGQAATAANALVKLLRLQQLSSGVITTEDGNVAIADRHKQAATADIIADIRRHDSVVVFCRFRGELQLVEEMAKGLKRPYYEISGRRKDITEHSRMLGDPGQILGVQIRSGGVGIDLTAAKYAFYWSHGLSLGDYEQSRARLVRPGQKHHVSFFHILTEGTYDRRTLAALQRREDAVKAILSAVNEETCDDR